MSDASEDKKEADGFLSRWSSRKRDQSKETVALREVEGAESLAPQDLLDTDPVKPLATTAESNADIGNRPASDPEQTALSRDLDMEEEETPLLTDEDMPEVPSLTAKSDLSMFFNRGVSAALRKKALRHVFSLPVYNERDGLNDYDDDFTNFEPLGDTITSDMKWHKARKERAAKEAAEREEEARRLAEEEAQQSEELDEQQAESSEQDDETKDSEQESIESQESDEPDSDQDEPVLIAESVQPSQAIELSVSENEFALDETDANETATANEIETTS